MRKKFLYLFAALFCCISVHAQSEKEYDKRPTSYNYNRAVEEINKENYATAMEYLDEELKTSPKNGWAWAWKCFVDYQYDNYGEALKEADNALKYIPKKDVDFVSYVYGTKAKIYAELEDTVQALAFFDKAISANTSSITYILDRCNLYFFCGDYDAAMQDVARMHKIKPNDPVVYTYDGRNKNAMGNYEEAIRCYTQALKLDSEYSSGYSFRAESYMALGKYSEASQDVVAALALDGDSKASDIMEELAEKSFTNIYTKLMAQKNKEPNNPYWAGVLGDVCFTGEKYCDALSYYKEALKTVEYQGVMIRRIASVYNNICRPVAGLEYLNRAVIADSTDEKSLYDRAELYLQLDRYQEAISDINALIALHPDYDSLYRLRAYARTRAGSLRNAIDDYTMAVEIDPDEPEYLLYRAVTYALLEKKAEAQADLKKVLELLEDPEYTEEYKDFIKCTACGWLYRIDPTQKAMRDEVLDISKRWFEASTAENGDLYNAACAHALADEPQMALAWLQKALDNGFSDFDNINHDFDLDPLRKMPEFVKMVESAKKDWVEKYNCDGDEVDDDATYEEVVTEVPFTRESGIYKVKCTINGLPLNFYFDTGASDVTMSNVEASFMMKNGYLSSKDVVGTQYYGTANGDISEGTVINLRSVEFGGLKLEGVKASVAHSQNAPLLLGQTVLSRLGKIEIDYEKSVLKITSRSKKIK